MKLKAVLLNCSLKKSPAVSNTQALMDIVTDHLDLAEVRRDHGQAVGRGNAEDRHRSRLTAARTESLRQIRAVVARPEAEVVVHGAHRHVRAVVAEGERRARIWEEGLRMYPGFDQYERRASHRQISVFVLEPVLAASMSAKRQLS